MMDSVDRKIISLLRKNGRANNAFLSQELGVDKSTIAKRINRLLDNEIISIKAVPNPFKFSGYQANALITLDVELQKVRSVCDKLVSNPNISTLLTCFGRYDIHLLVSYPDWETIDNFVKEDLSRLEGIHKIETFFVSKIIKRYEGIFENHPDEKSPVVLNEFDRKLVEELQENGRITYAELAKIFGVSVATISRRTTLLINKGIIRIMAVPNPAKLGYLANAHISLNVLPDKLYSICHELSKYEPVYLVMTLMSGFDILAGVKFPDPSMLHEFIIEKISKIEGIVNIETFVHGEIKKANYAHFDPDDLSNT